MFNFAVFDSIVDSVFVVDRDGTVVYCNDAAARFSEVSTKRSICRRTLTEFFSLSSPGILPLTEPSPGWIITSGFVETEFHVFKSARIGKGRVSVTPINDNHWLIYLRDVCLDEALEAECGFAAMIVCLLRNRDQFMRFLVSAQETVVGLVDRAKSGLKSDQLSEEFRILHTLEGEAGTFSIPVLVNAARTSQALLEPFLGLYETPVEIQSRYLESILRMHSKFEMFIRRHDELFKMNKGFEKVLFKVPLVSRLDYFNHLLQTMSTSLEKKVKPLVIEGGDLLIYPEPYERFFSALVHVFRNAMDHGIETPEQREAIGKPLEGEIRIAAQRRDGRIMITVIDDGRGIDPNAIRSRLLEKFPDCDFSQQSDEQVICNVITPGFSSREEVGEFSGRGLGLDALRKEIFRLGGSLSLTSKWGQGTVIDMHLPDLDHQVNWSRSA